MKVHFLGAARTTTGSMYLVEVDGRKFLLECGLHQGRRDESTERNRTFPFDPRELDAVVLSHAHIDHCGNLPNLVKQGFDGNIYCTHATRDLAVIMLADSAKIQQSDSEFVSRQRARRGEPPVLPLYSPADAEKTTRLFVAVGYGRPLPVTDGVTVTFVDAGHILGAAQVVLDVREGGRKFRYLFSGDVGRPDQSILRDPEPVADVDFLQIESTYGARDHGSAANSLDELDRMINAAIDRGGRVIIPAFSVGRTQTLVYELHQLTLAGRLPRLPIFVDSPLSVNATEVFRLHPECFDDETNRFLQEQGNPFGMSNLTYIRDVEQSKKLNDIVGPCVVISASGMAEAGRIRHHLKNNVGDPKNLILFVGFCADHTLGAQLRGGSNPVNIFGEPQVVRAQVAAIDAFSGHADRKELAWYVGRLTGDIRKISVVHGEEEQSLAFAETLRTTLRPGAEVTVPVRGQVIEF